MNPETYKQSGKVIFPILFGFFIMGFVDVVGIATNYIKNDFDLSDTVANLLPMMVFLWFALCSIPTGILMSRIGRRNTVALSFLITVAAMILPLLAYDFTITLFAFALLGISNTILQVSLNPMMAQVVSPDKVTSVLTLGQFIKAISSFLGPIIAGAAVSCFGNWKLIFFVYAVTSVLAAIWLLLAIGGKEEKTKSNVSFSSTVKLLKDNTILLFFFGILCIVGIDVGLNTSIPRLLMEKTGMPLSEAGLGTSMYFAFRTIGSFVGAIILVKFAARRFLIYSVLVAIVSFICLLITGVAWQMYSLIAVVGFACANIFSIILSLALQHKPERSNEISALMIMGVSGGALFTPIIGVLSDSFGQAIGLSVLLFCMIYILIIAKKG